MAGDIHPVMWLEKPPLVVSIVKQFTGASPMADLVADAVNAAERPGVLDTSVAEGYPYADVEHMGMAFIAVADVQTSIAVRYGKRCAPSDF